MFGMTKPYVQIGHDDKGLYINKGWCKTAKVRIEAGYTLSLTISRNDHSDWRMLTLQLVTYKRGTVRKWRKEGHPTGPGGTLVWATLAAMWDEVEEEMRNMAGGRPTTLEVTAATPKLFRIYKTFLLRKPGYWLEDDETICKGIN